MLDNFGALGDGTKVICVSLSHGPFTAKVMSWGATLQDLRHADLRFSLVIGSDRLDDYRGPLRYAGAVVGRVANRIGGARAVLNGQELRFEANEGANILHSGEHGLSDQNWTVVEQDTDHVTLEVVSPDGTCGFPGNLTARCTYRLTDEGLHIELSGETDAPTFCNLAHHGYWNLDGRSDLSKHQFQVKTDLYTPLNKENIPTGPAIMTLGTSLNFTAPKPPLIDGGLDHNFCLSDAPSPEPRLACTLETDKARLDLFTDAPGLQAYDARHFDGSVRGHDGRVYDPHPGLALEPQHWPDAPNAPSYPDITLAPEQIWRQKSLFAISAK